MLIHRGTTVPRGFRAHVIACPVISVSTSLLSDSFRENCPWASALVSRCRSPTPERASCNQASNILRLVRRYRRCGPPWGRPRTLHTAYTPLLALGC